MDVESQDHTTLRNSRGRGFIITGNILSYFFVFAFIFLIANAFIQLDFWKAYFYEDTLRLDNSCLLATKVTAKADLKPADFSMSIKKPIEVPHSKLPEFERKATESDYRHVYYLCQVSSDKASPKVGLAYLHVSWLYGESSKVYINDKLKAAFNGLDKPSIPLQVEDLSQELIKIEIISTGNNKSERIGLQGGAPSVIAITQKQNFKIFGIETALQNVRYLINVLPLLTLSLVLTFGWFLGIRSRLVLTVFVYFGFAIVRNFLILYLDIWPWDYNSSYNYAASCTVGLTISLFVFVFEFIKFGGRYLNHFLQLGAISVPALWMWVSYSDKPFQVNEMIKNLIFLGTITGALAVMIISSFKIYSKKIESYLVTPTIILNGIIALLGIATVVDRFGLIESVLLVVKIDVIMPFAIGGFLFYVLKLIQDRYNDERERRHKMEADLEIAKEIQDSMSPPPRDTRFGNYVLSSYQIKHSQVAGDWMAVRHNGEGEILVVIADVTGKGIQAALVVHAIQSMWAESLGREVIDPEDWIIRLNRTLFTLGEQKPHSATLGLLQIRKGSVQYYCMGHIPVFIVDAQEKKVHSLLSRGSIMGISQEVVVEPRVFDVSKIPQFHILLATDGVFDKGSRTRPREILSFLDLLLAHGEESLIDRDQGDDRTLFHIHN